MFFGEVASFDNLFIDQQFNEENYFVSITAVVIVDRLSTMNNNYCTVMSSLWFIGISYGY